MRLARAPSGHERLGITDAQGNVARKELKRHFKRRQSLFGLFGRHLRLAERGVQQGVALMMRDQRFEGGHRAAGRPMASK